MARHRVLGIKASRKRKALVFSVCVLVMMHGARARALERLQRPPLEHVSLPAVFASGSRLTRVLSNPRFRYLVQGRQNGALA